MAALLLGLLLGLAASGPAQAVIRGTGSSLGAHTVRIAGSHYCTGVAIAQTLIVTAAHCAGRSMRVVGGGRTVGVSKSAALDDGRRVQVSGDAAILRVTHLPGGVSPVAVGPGHGDSFTIAGYGTANEASRAAFGTLREARLVQHGAFALVDPHRSGSIGASACFGDSGGPVMRGSALVGIVTRAAHPHPRIACGHLTRWAPVTVSGAPSAQPAATAGFAVAATEAAPPRRGKRRATRRVVASAAIDPMFRVGRVD